MNTLGQAEVELRPGVTREPRSIVRAWSQPMALVALITLGGLALRLAFLGDKSLWLDEAATVAYAGLKPTQIVQLSSESHPPLYYLMMHLWIALGQSEVMLRLPSAVMGALTLPVLYGLARDRAGPWVALLATALLAASPLHIWYSQEARMYSLVCALALLASLCAMRAVRGQGRAYWLGAALTTLAALYTNYMAVVWLLSLDLIFLALARREPQVRAQMKHWGLAHAAILVGYLPWLPILALQTQSGFLQSGSFKRVFGPWLRLLSGGQSSEPWPVVVLVTGAVLVALLLGLTWWRGAVAIAWLSRRSWLSTALVAVFVLSLASMLVPRGYLVKRASLIWLPYLLVGVAWAIARTRRHRLLAAGGVALSLVVSLYTITSLPKDHWREAAALIQAEQMPTDAILLQPEAEDTVFYYYYEGDHNLIRLPSNIVQLDPSILGTETTRVWLVQFALPPPAPTAVRVGWLNGRYPLLLSRDWDRVHVRLYAVR